MLTIDIETAPHLERYPVPTPEMVKVPGNYSKPESILAYKNDPKNQLEAHKKLSLDPLRCQIVGVAVCTEGGAVFDGASLDERELLEALDDWLLSLNDEDGPAHALAGWNAHSFDFRILTIRALAMGMPELAKRVKPGRRWDDKVRIDLMTALWGTDYRSLEDTCEGFGIEYETAGQGSKVYEWVNQARFTNWGSLDRVRYHVADDVKVEMAVALKLREAGIINPQR